MGEEKIDLRTDSMKIDGCIRKVEELEKKVEKIENQKNALFPIYSNHFINIDKEIAELKEYKEIFREWIQDHTERAHKNLESVLIKDYKFKIKNLPDNELKDHYKECLKQLEGSEGKKDDD